MQKLLILLIAVAASGCASAESKKSEQSPHVNVSAAASVTPTPMGSNDFTALKKFAENYEPKSGREVIPSPPVLSPELSKLVGEAARTESRAHEPFVVLIFLKLGRFHVEHFKQSYELGRENPLTKEFYRLIGETKYERAELMGSYLAENYVKNHADLLDYAPIKAEMLRIDKAGEKIRREALKN
jgi:hypothetical protein